MEQLLFRVAIFLAFGFLGELFYRSYYSHKIVWPKVINVQMYGWSGFAMHYLVASQLPIWLVFLLLILVTTGIELITGSVYLSLTGNRLWDYQNEFFNYRGIICLKFSLLWLVMSLGYYLVWK